MNGLLSFKVAPTGKIDLLSLSLNPLTYAVFHEAEFDCSMGEGSGFPLVTANATRECVGEAPALS